MMNKALFLFLILLFGLVLCSFLGGYCRRDGFTNASTADDSSTNPATETVSTSDHPDTGSTESTNYDNYNHYSGSSHPAIFYGPNGATARVIQTNGNDTIVITQKNGNTEIFYIDHKKSKNKNNSDKNNSDNKNKEADITSKVFTGPNGGSGQIITTANGAKALKVTLPDGSSFIFTATNSYINDGSQSSDTTTNTDADTTNQTSDYSNAYKQSFYNYPASTNGASGVVVTGPQGNSAAVVTGPNGNTYAATNYDPSAYQNSLPPGVPASQIPPGSEDLYILKSEIVPPVCPACPACPTCPANADAKKCQPCPPCGRCPEPSFECKKVPNYNSFNPDQMPVPVMTDFSSFGM